MSERLVVSFTPAEGAVIRMLGLVERRGYSLLGLAMDERADGACITIDLQPRDASRRVEVVARQLDRLVDVNSVFVATPKQGSPS